MNTELNRLHVQVSEIRTLITYLTDAVNVCHRLNDAEASPTGTFTPHLHRITCILHGDQTPSGFQGLDELLDDTKHDIREAEQSAPEEVTLTWYIEANQPMTIRTANLREGQSAARNLIAGGATEASISRDSVLLVRVYRQGGKVLVWTRED